MDAMGSILLFGLGLGGISLVLDLIMKSYGSKNRPAEYVAMDKFFDPKPLSDFSKISGRQFENHVFEIFKEANWYPQQTPESGDAGVDVLATSPNGTRYAIECKNWKNPVGNEVVRSIFSGKRTYKCQKAIIVSARSDFTKPARNQARSLQVILLHITELKRWIETQP